MVISNSMTRGFGSKNSIPMRGKQLKISSLQKNLFVPSRWRCIVNCLWVEYHPILVLLNIELGNFFLRFFSERIDLLMFLVFVLIFSGCWLPAPAPVVKNEVQVYAEKPKKISDKNWQIPLTLNGKNISTCEKDQSIIIFMSFRQLFLLNTNSTESWCKINEM